MSTFFCVHLEEADDRCINMIVLPVTTSNTLNRFKACFITLEANLEQ